MAQSETDRDDWRHWTDEQLLDRLAEETSQALGRVYQLDLATRMDPLDLPVEDCGGCRLWLKREDLSNVHSYKWRGAFNKIKAMHEQGFAGTLVAASAGNHAQGVAVAAARLKLPATIFMPRTTPLLKQDSVRQFGGSFVTIELAGDSFEEAAVAAKEFEESQGGTFIPPYDDLLVIAGQSTIGMEIAACNVQPTHVFLPIGGGGMAAGVASVLRKQFPSVQLIGVEAENQHSMSLSLRKGSRQQIDWLDRFCDGTAVSCPGELTFRLCQLLLDDVVVISNDKVCEAIHYLWQKLRLIVEPSAALGVAAALATPLSRRDHPVTVLSGSNVDFMTLPKIAMRGQAQRPETKYYAFEISERSGSLASLLDRFAGNMNIIDFQYGKVHEDEAYPVIGIEVPHACIDQLHQFLADPSLPHHVDVTGTAASEFRVIPFNVDRLKLPWFAVIYFANRPGALRDFMHQASRFASVCYMNYSDTGQTEGQALMGFEFEDAAARTAFMNWLESSQCKHDVVDIEVVRHFTGASDATTSWKNVANQTIRQRQR